MQTTHTITVDPSNAEALSAWDGYDGGYWAEQEDVFDRSLQHYRDAFRAAAGLRRGEDVLDIGCGNGQTTREAARLVAPGRVLGVDLSTRMLERARRHADEAGLENVDLVRADAQVHPFEPGSFDVAISRTGTMFFGDPVAAFANIGRALRPGGRLALLVWQGVDDNEWFRELRRCLAAGRDLPLPPPYAPGPFSMADADRGRAVLAAAGFSDVRHDGVAAPMWFGPTVEQAHRFLAEMGFSRYLLRGLDDDVRARALEDLHSSLAAHLTDEGVVYDSAVWLVTARR